MEGINMGSFLFGFISGGMFCLVLMCLLRVASDSDDQMEQELKKRQALEDEKNIKEKDEQVQKGKP